MRYLDGSRGVEKFFASRLKWSRWAAVDLTDSEDSETVIRTVADHFVLFGGMPLCAVFDRPKTVALKWNERGEVTEWNPVFAYAALELGFTAELCWPYRANQKGAVENLVGWVKGSFFKQRRFHDRDDLRQQLRQWVHEMNHQRPNRATVYLFEFKVVEMSPPGSALAQLRERDYAAKYRGRGEPIHLIGVEFSRKTRNVTAFEVAAG